MTQAGMAQADVTQFGSVSRDDRLTLWALRRARCVVGADIHSPALRAASLYRRFLHVARLGGGVRVPRVSPPGCPTVTKDERRLLRAVAAARAGDERLLDNRLYRLALDRPARRMLAGAVRAWAKALATGLRTSPLDTAERSSTMDMNVASNAERPRLPIPETVLLWAVRSWVRGRQRGVSAEDEISRIFTSLGAADASASLFGLMWVIGHAACRPLAVHCPCHATMSADERALLDVLALTQERDGFERLMLLRTLVRPTATVAAGQSATQLVQTLNRAGLFLTASAAPVRHCAFPSEASA